jgi:HKD family nuclease
MKKDIKNLLPFIILVHYRLHMQLISSPSSHQDVLNKYIPECDSISIAVAFLKVSGLKIIIDSLVDAAKNGCTIEIICGLDFGLTEPQALRELYELTSKYKKVSLLLASSKEHNVTFHPKFYLLKKGNNATILVGSANLTSGGLNSNFECSLLVRENITSEIFKQCISYFNSLKLPTISEKANHPIINKYESFFNLQCELRKKIQAKPDKPYWDLNSKYYRLQQLYHIYKERQDINAIFTERVEKYKTAKIVLDQIADTPNLTQEEFKILFEQLVGTAGADALWHSTGIYRLKGSVFKYQNQFQALVNYVRENKNQPIPEVFNHSKFLVEAIKGSGVNTVTEIMMTYDPKRFANLNANPIKVLSDEVGITIKKNITNFNGGNYEKYCQLVSEISVVLGLKNMLEVDSFFNEIYQGFLNVQE